MQKTFTKISVFALLVFLLAVAVGAAQARVLEPVRTSDGQALKAMYFYPHWWDPWKSDDAALSADMKKIKDLGFNTICVDHEASQAVDNDFGWLNREYKFAAQQNLFILPWLQLQAADRQGLMKFSHLKLQAAVDQDKKVQEDYINFRDQEFKDALARYVSAYLDQYADSPALLKVKVGKKVVPVVGLIIEAGWHDGSGMPLSFDEDTNAYFRKWMKSSHHDIKQLNKKWGTSYKSFDEIDPCDKKIFDYACTDKENMPMAVREHTLFRARMINEAMEYATHQVRKHHKDVQFVAEVAYPFGSTSPDAGVYRWNAANDQKAIEFSDILFVRTTGGTITGEVKKQQNRAIADGKQVVTAYRLTDGATQKNAIGLAIDGAESGNGIAYYNWNEHADNASAAYNNADRQALLKTMTDVYTLLCDPEQRHNLVAAPADTVKPVEPAVLPALPAPLPTSTPEPAKVDQKPVDAQVAPAQVTPTNTVPAVAPASVPPAPVTVPAAPTVVAPTTK